MKRALALALVNVLIIAGGITRIATHGPSDNGESKKPVKQIEADTEATLRSASSVRLVATNIDDGDGTGQKLSFDITVVAKVGGRGRVTEAGKTVFVIKIGDDLYANDGSKAGGETDVTKVTDGWVKLSADNPGRADLGNIFNIVSGLTDDDSADTDTYTKSRAVITSYGRKVFTITDTTDGSLVHISNTGPPQLVDVREGPGADSGAILFSDYNKKVTLTPPAHFTTQGGTTT